MKSKASTLLPTADPGADGHCADPPADAAAALETRAPRDERSVTPDGNAVAEPAWDEIVYGLARSRRRHDLLSREIGLQLRLAFTQVGEFLALVNGGGASLALIAVLDDIIRNTDRGFKLAARLHADSARVSADKTACLSDLAQLRLALCADLPPAPRELSHSMDALIVQFVRIDVERNNPPGVRRQLLSRFAREQAGSGAPDLPN
jgi:hypothetical protein